ncbi:GNAT family N-acetyltransferase [Tessaracoccus rhinocerotis]|uniref:GNAT family N-acetyltransferase n=1 Tax=Tessaracoccus rhinocerotis TaxID=1689449 RepID=A0A553K5U7_9ACTN|nr:N-acetyltransferase [Tessaracoccus rhinocerotis]TRY20061.1 GNAT family N-acetyltransferase [Tessaracoccus rhinocerotis]
MSEINMEDYLRWLTADEAVARAGRIANIYREAFNHTDEAAAQFAKDFARCMGTNKGATCLVGEIDGEILGFVYGYDLRPDNWWPQQIAGAMSEAGHLHWFEDAFELAEIEVDPAVHGQGLGGALLDTQLDAMRQSRALLATHPDNPARALYRRKGFVDLLSEVTYPDNGERACVMGWER